MQTKTSLEPQYCRHSLDSSTVESLHNYHQTRVTFLYDGTTEFQWENCPNKWINSFLSNNPCNFPCKHPWRPSAYDKPIGVNHDDFPGVTSSHSILPSRDYKITRRNLWERVKKLWLQCKPIVVRVCKIFPCSTSHCFYLIQSRYFNHLYQWFTMIYNLREKLVNIPQSHTVTSHYHWS